MNILLTGSSGFVGKHFMDVIGCEELELNGNKVDLLDIDSLRKCLHNKQNIEYVVHLAAQSFVPDSIRDPRNTYDVNFIGTLNILSVLKDLEFKGKFLFVSSSDVYGLVHEQLQPISESIVPRPRNPYAVSKVAAEALCTQWSFTSGFDIVIARPFNHIGPGQSEKFVISDFAKQLTEIKLAIKSPEIFVGDIEVSRDFTDVRDVIKAYMMLLEYGENSEIYNIASNKSIKIINILETMRDLIDSDIQIIVDESKLRKSEQRIVKGDYSKLNHLCGWTPTVGIEQTLQDTLIWWEKKLND